MSSQQESSLRDRRWTGCIADWPLDGTVLLLRSPMLAEHSIPTLDAVRAGM